MSGSGPAGPRVPGRGGGGSCPSSRAPSDSRGRSLCLCLCVSQPGREAPARLPAPPAPGVLPQPPPDAGLRVRGPAGTRPRRHRRTRGDARAAAGNMAARPGAAALTPRPGGDSPAGSPRGGEASQLCPAAAPGPVRPGRGDRPALSPCRDTACGSVGVSEEPRGVRLRLTLEGEALLHRKSGRSSGSGLGVSGRWSKGRFLAGSAPSAGGSARWDKGQTFKRPLWPCRPRFPLEPGMFDSVLGSAGKCGLCATGLVYSRNK